MVPHTRGSHWAALLFLFATVVRAQTTVQWQNASNGQWFNASNWVLSSTLSNIVPTNSQRAVVNSAVTVTAGGSANANVLALDLGAAGATALFDFSSSAYGLSLGNGTSNWTAGNAEFRTSYGIYGNGSSNSTLNIASGVELLFSASTSSSARNLYNLTVANAGTIHATSGSLSVSYTNLTNQAGGLIHADGAEIDFGAGASLNNLGTIRATGSSGLLNFSNTLTTANLGSVQLVNGARAILSGTLTNTSATLAVPSGGTYELTGGRITGGTIASGAVTFTNSNGYLDGATLTGDFSLPNSTSVRLTNGAGFTGSNATLGTSATLYWQQAATLAGKSLTFGSGSEIYLSGGNVTLTLDSATTGTGDITIDSDGNTGSTIVNHGTLTHTSSSSGVISAPSLTNTGTITNTAANTSLSIGSSYSAYHTANTGNITVNASGATIYLDGDVDNTGGTITATNGQLIFRGNNTTAHLAGGTVSVASGAHAYLNGVLDNTGATLNAPASGVFELYGGTITGGTINAGALAFTNYGGDLDGVSIAGDLSLAASAYVHFLNGASFAGSNATLAGNSSLYWEQTGSLNGKSLSFGSGSSLYVTGANHALTLDAESSANGDIQIYTDGSAGTAVTLLGTVTHNSTSSGWLYAPTLTNGGTISNVSDNTSLTIGSSYNNYVTTNTGHITVNGNGATIYLDGSLDNTGGTLTATNGQLIFRGPNTTAHLNGGTVNIASGAHAYLNGTLDNSGHTLNAPTTGTYELYGGTITGGSIAPGALTFTNYGGYLDGTTVNDSLTLPASTYVRMQNNATFAGANATLGGSSNIYWEQSGSLDGKALNFGSNSSLYVAGANHTLTVGANTTATGDVSIYTDGSDGTAITIAGTITHTSATGGSLSAPLLTITGSVNNQASNSSFTIGSSYNNYATTNTGTIAVSGSGATVYLDGNVDNTGGHLTATSGQLIFRGTNTTGHLNGGTVSISNGAHAYLNGTLDNSGATLSAPVTGSYELYGGTISNGTVAAGALSYTGYGGTLANVTLLGNVTVPSSAYVNWTGGTKLGTANAAVTLAGNGGIYWNQSGSLSGAALNFGSNGYIYLSGANSTLTLDSATTATGQVQIYGDGSSGSTLTNQGTLTHTNGTGYLSAQTFTNSGTIIASGGTLYLGTNATGSAVTNAAGGTLRLNGGNIALAQPATNPLVNNGVIDIQSGVLYTNNRLSNGLTGAIRGAGVITGNLVVAGGTLSPGNTGIGALTFNTGTLTITGASTLAIDIGGSNTDQLVFQNPGSIVDLGNGLLSLSLNLLSAPNANTSFNLISINSGGMGLTGTFAGLPTTGSTVTAYLNGTAFNFSVNYQPNFVALSYNPVVVPEPSTYLLIGTGLVLMAVRQRRRRGTRSS